MAMRLSTATAVLNETSALSAIEALHYDVVENQGPLDYTAITVQIAGQLDPVNDYLKTPLYSVNQFARAAANLDYKYGLVRRNRRGGHVRGDDRTVADEVFKTRRNFGCSSIDELKEAISVVKNHLVDTEKRRIKALKDLVTHSVKQVDEIGFENETSAEVKKALEGILENLSR